MQDALSRLAAAALALLRTRAEIAALDFDEAGKRAKERVALLVVGLLCLAVGILAATAFVIVIFWDSNRLAMILAVLEAHCRVRLGDCDVYLNVAGGLKIAEPAADLAVAAALVSSRLQVPLPPDCVYFGEVSLSGAVRPVAHAAARLKEAQKLGFATSMQPGGAKDADSVPGARSVDQLADLVATIAARVPRDGRD